ncbi:MAG: EutN/CcmL family microcompartment protein [Armatimonadota bacterium]
MIVGKVTGNLWATIQDKHFNGEKIFFVTPYNALTGRFEGTAVLAVDTVGSGIGDNVLLFYEGNSARQVLGCSTTPAEAVIVGFVDEINVKK